MCIYIYCTHMYTYDMNAYYMCLHAKHISTCGQGLLGKACAYWAFAAHDEIQYKYIYIWTNFLEQHQLVDDCIYIYTVYIYAYVYIYIFIHELPRIGLKTNQQVSNHWNLVLVWTCFQQLIKTLTQHIKPTICFNLAYVFPKCFICLGITLHLS